MLHATTKYMHIEHRVKVAKQSHYSSYSLSRNDGVEETCSHYHAETISSHNHGALIVVPPTEIICGFVITIPVFRKCWLRPSKCIVVEHVHQSYFARHFGAIWWVSILAWVTLRTIRLYLRHYLGFRWTVSLTLLTISIFPVDSGWSYATNSFLLYMTTSITAHIKTCVCLCCFSIQIVENPKLFQTCITCAN